MTDFPRGLEDTRTVWKKYNSPEVLIAFSLGCRSLLRLAFRGFDKFHANRIRGNCYRNTRQHFCAKSRLRRWHTKWSGLGYLQTESPCRQSHRSGCTLRSVCSYGDQRQYERFSQRRRPSQNNDLVGFVLPQYPLTSLSGRSAGWIRLESPFHLMDTTLLPQKVARTYAGVDTRFHESQRRDNNTLYTMAYEMVRSWVSTDRIALSAKPP